MEQYHNSLLELKNNKGEIVGKKSKFLIFVLIIFYLIFLSQATFDFSVTSLLSHIIFIVSLVLSIFSNNKIIYIISKTLFIALFILLFAFVGFIGLMFTGSIFGL